MSDNLPDTDTHAVITAAIAWEIVKNTFLPTLSADNEENLVKTTNAYIKVMKAINRLVVSHGE